MGRPQRPSPRPRRQTHPPPRRRTPRSCTTRPWQAVSRERGTALPRLAPPNPARPRHDGPQLLATWAATDERVAFTCLRRDAGRRATARHPHGVCTDRMRAIWTGAITFGLVNVPVKLYSATEDHDIALHQVHAKDGGRIRYQAELRDLRQGRRPTRTSTRHTSTATAPSCSRDDELEALPAEHNHEIDVVEFVPSEQIDPILLDRSYYLEPDCEIAQGVRAAAAHPRARTAPRSCSSRCDRRRASLRCACATTCS